MSVTAPYRASTLRGLLSIVSTFLALSLWAQPTFFVEPDQVVANNGDVVCLDIEVDDFTDLLTLEFEFAFDSTVLAFERVDNIALTNMTPANLTLAGPGRGRLEFNWTAPGASAGNGVTFPDFQPIFQICFRVIGSYGQSSPVNIAASPAPRVTRENSGNRNIGLFQEDGLVAIGVLPLSLKLGTASGAENSNQCIEVTADNYTRITRFAYSHQWDQSVLRFTNVRNINAALTGLSAASFTSPGFGSLTVDYPDGGAITPTTLPRGTLLYELCFDLVGECDESSTVSVTDSPAAIAVFNNQSAQPIGLTATEGQVDVFSCTGGLRLQGNVRTASPGDVVCVPFEVRGFQLLTTVNLNIDFDPTELQFTGVQVPTVGVPLSFTAANFNTAAAGTGRITLAWTGSPSSVANGRVLFELCFRALGNAGTTAQITPVAAGATVIQSGTNIGLNPRVGEVVLLSNTQLELTVGSALLERGQEVCIDFTVDQFINLQTVRFSVNWNQSILRYERFENFALPNIQANTFTPGADFIEFDWWDFSGSSLTDGSVLFSLCFTVIGPPGLCTDLEISDSPRPIFIESAATQGYNSGLSWNDGEVCAKDDRLFRLDVASVTGSSAGPVCVPMTVNGLANLREASFTLAWDPTRFDYSSVQNDVTGLLAADLSETPQGRAGFIIEDSANPLDLNYPDGTVLFELCLQPLSISQACTPILEEISPVANRAMDTDGFVGRVDIRMGQLCAEPGLTVEEVITPTTCSDGSDGAIALQVSGAGGSYAFTWSPVPPGAVNNQNQTGLAPGNYTVIVQDANDASISFTGTYTVGFIDESPVANAGVDLDLPCTAGDLQDLDASATDLSGGRQVNWRALGGGVLEAGATTLRPTVSGEGEFELTVTSPAGCVDVDTVSLTRDETPEITVEEQGTIDCAGTPVVLRVSVQPTGTYSFAWSTGDGSFAAGPTNQAAVLVTSQGNYDLLVRNEDTGCEVSTSLFVDAITGDAVADAGSDKVITCTETSQIIGGATTSQGVDYEYRWTTPNGALNGPTTARTVEATQPGRYFLEVLQVSTGCTDLDSVEVTGATGVPVAEAGETFELTCDVTMYTLQGTGSQGNNFSIRWTTADGALNPGTETRFDAEATGPGTYTLEVTNLTSGCRTSSSVTLTQNIAEPTLALPATQSIGCTNSSLLIDPAYAQDSSGYDFRWVNSGGDTVGRTATLSIPGPGNFTLIVSDLTNGCQAQRSIQIDQRSLPVVDLAASESEFICGRDSILLDLRSSTGLATSDVVTWIGQQPAGSADPLVYYATAPGSYRPVIGDALSGCYDTLSTAIQLTDARTILPVDAGTDLILNCGQTSVDAVAQPPVDNSWTLLWTGLDGTQPIDPGNIAAGFSESGRYVLTFTDPQTACTGRDTIQVTRQTSDDLEVDAGRDTTLTCSQLDVSLTAAGTAPTADVSYEWRSLTNTGLVLPPSATVTVTEPGQFVVTLTYAPTGCTIADTVEVSSSGQDFVV